MAEPGSSGGLDLGTLALLALIAACVARHTHVCRAGRGQWDTVGVMDLDGRAGTVDPRDAVPLGLAVLVAVVLVAAGSASVLGPPAVAAVLVGPTIFLAVFSAVAALLV